LHANSFRGICKKKVDKLTSKKYAQTINLLCASNKVFGKYESQAWAQFGGGHGGRVPPTFLDEGT